MWYTNQIPMWLSGKESTCQLRRYRRCRFNLCVREDPLEEEMATHSSILARKIPWMQEPGGLQSMGLQRVRHDRATSLSLYTFSDFHHLLHNSSKIWINNDVWKPLANNIVISKVLPRSAEGLAVRESLRAITIHRKERNWIQLNPGGEAHRI